MGETTCYKMNRETILNREKVDFFLLLLKYSLNFQQINHYFHYYQIHYEIHCLIHCQIHQINLVLNRNY